MKTADEIWSYLIEQHEKLSKDFDEAESIENHEERMKRKTDIVNESRILNKIMKFIIE